VIKWSSWSSGAKVIFIAVCLAVMSLLMPWVDIGIASRNGISQGTFLLLLFWLYPVLTVLMNKTMQRWLGGIMGVVSAALTMAYIASKTTVLFGETRNFAAMGADAFMLSSLVMVVGCFMYRPFAAQQGTIGSLEIH